MRLGRLICGDIHFQWKYGFYFIYFILTVLYVCGIAALPEHWKTDIASIMIYSDPAAMGLFFMGAIVLLEKSQKVLNAMVVSPVKISEYILSKTVALIAISTVIALILGLVSGSNHLLGIAVGTALTSAIFTMLGIIAATKISNLNQFLIVIMPIEIVCFVPPIAGLFVTLPDVFCFFPFMACMNLITGKSMLLSFDMVIVIATLIILYIIARDTVEHMWKSLGGVKAMKKILSSAIQVFKQIKSDPMMFAACFTPFIMGALIKFGIPFFERITKFSLQGYYPIFDLLLSIMAPVLLCFAFAMITLEEIDDKVSRYFSITPLGKAGYLFTRLVVPAIISAVIAFIVLLFFSLEKLPVGITVGLAFLGSIQAIIVSLMIITLSTNKLEGMAVTKLSALTLLGIPVPFFYKRNGSIYRWFSCPPFWVRESNAEQWL